MNGKRIYLAGPDVFREDTSQHFNLLKALAHNKGIEAYSPFDSENIPSSAKEIFNANIEIMNKVDAVFANIIPFRGPGVDDGTAFELGYAFSKGLKLYGYSQLSLLTYPQIVAEYSQSTDTIFPVIESFGYTCNLMIAEAILMNKGKIFETFEECLTHFCTLGNKE